MKRNLAMAYKYIHIIILMAASVWLSSCSDDYTPADSLRQEGGAVFVVSGITPATRMAYTGYTGSAFDGGEELGACVIRKTDKTTTVNGTVVLPVYEYLSEYNQNVRYKVKAGGTQQVLEPVIPTDIYPTGEKYVFYYPYKVGADITNFSHTVLADQSRKEAFETSDLLRARVNAVTGESAPVVTPTVSDDGKTISVNMEHVMACIVIKAETDLIDGNVTLLQLYRSVSGIDLTRTLTKEQQPNTYPTIPGETTQKGDIKMYKTEITESGTDGTTTSKTYNIYRAAIPAQEIAANSEFIKLKFKDGSTEVTYKMSANGSSPLDCHPGCYYLFTITKDKGLRFAGLINDLDNGGDYYYEY